MASVSTTEPASSCGVCRRTLLLGEEVTRFSTGDERWVTVCALCRETAGEYGWVKEGAPVAPVVSHRRRRFRRVSRLAPRAEPAARRRDPMPETHAGHGSYEQRALEAAVDLFNESAFRRTIAGIGKSLGTPSVSLLHLSGTNPEVVITVAWEISWYQYRVVFDSGQPIRLADRGYELADLDPRFTQWNASLDDELRLSITLPPGADSEAATTAGSTQTPGAA